MSGTNDTKEYVIERTSKNDTDMGNNLYFLLHHTVAGFYGVTLKSCELYFTAEGAFDAKVTPGSPADIVSQGVNMYNPQNETFRKNKTKRIYLTFV